MRSRDIWQAGAAIMLAGMPASFAFAQDAGEDQSLYSQLRRLNGEAALKRAMLELNELDEKIANSKAAQRRSSQQFNVGAAAAPSAIMSLPPPVVPSPVAAPAPAPVKHPAVPTPAPVLPRILNIGGINGVLVATLLLPDGRRQQDVGVGTVLDGGYRVTSLTPTAVHVAHGRSTIPLIFAKPAISAGAGRPSVNIFDLPPPQAR